MSSLLLIKILLPIAFVFALTSISERVSPRMAGIIGGSALGGTSINLFIFALEHGGEFVAEVAPWTIAGIGAEIMFYVFYYLGIKITAKSKSRALSILISSLLAIGSFVLSGYALFTLNLDITSAIFIMLTAVAIGSYVMRNVDNGIKINPERFTLLMLTFRVFTVTLFVLLITSVPGWLGPRWAGIFSAFATATFPVLLILQYSYGNRACMPFLKNISWSITSLALYVILVSYFYVTLGVYEGTLIAFVISFLYLILVNKLFGSVLGLPQSFTNKP